MAAETETVEGQPKRNKLLGGIIAGGALVALIAGFAMLMSSCGPSDEEKAEKAAERKKGQHCLSTLKGRWHGHHVAVYQEIQNFVDNAGGDRDSVTAYLTNITPMDENGNHTLRMLYNARNAFGVKVEAEATALVENDGCKATILSYE